MSHFVVLVTGDCVDDQLAPFQENSDNPEFREFEDRTDELKNDWETGTITMVKTPDGKLHHRYEMREKGKRPKGSTEVEVSFKDVYSDFDTFAKEYSGVEYDEEMKAYGYYTNPNSKWDWYTVGGRWSGFFITKYNNRGDKKDSLLKGEVDWDKMRSAAGKEAASEFDKYADATAGIDPPPTWEEVVASHKNIEDARKFWHSHPWVEAIKAAGFAFFLTDLHDHFFVGSPDARNLFIERAKRRAFSTYAILHEGTWMEKGRMGWFGMSHDEMDEDAWLDYVAKFVDELPDDTPLTIVDCHI